MFGKVSASVALLGVGIEAVADYQKTAFKQNYPGEPCCVGLWAVTQHPNYAGDLMVWYGLLGLAGPVLIGAPGPPWQAAVLRVMAGGTGPVFLTALFMGQATGTVGDALEKAEAKWGSLPSWKKYRLETPLLFPVPSLLGRA